MAVEPGGLDPLEMIRGCDFRVPGHGVVVGAVEVVGPLIDAARPGLLPLLPALAVAGPQAAQGGDDPLEFLCRDTERVFSDQDIDRAIIVGQLFAG